MPKTSRREVDIPTRNRIIGYYHATGNAAEAGRKENVQPRTAQRIIKHYEVTGSVADKARIGRPKKLNSYDKRQLARTARKERRTPFQQIVNEIGLQISVSTVRRVLAEGNYHRRVALRVPFLTNEHKRARLNWARINSISSMANFRRVIYSDECYICLDDHQGRIFVTRRPNEAFLEECLIPTFKQSSIRVMVWGCIIEGWKGPLVVLDYPGGHGGGMTSKRYQEQVLEPYLFDFYKRMNELRGHVKFQQDNAPSHISKMSKKWFAAKNIPLTYHPPSSPDLNPIEPIWHILKTSLRGLQHQPNTVDELKLVVHAAWDSLPIDRVDHFIGTMPDRVKAVLAARGGHIQF